MSNAENTSVEIADIKYTPPLRDMNFLLKDVFGDEAGQDFRDDFFPAAAEFAQEQLAPLSGAGDAHGAKLDGTMVITAPGWKEAYQQFCDQGFHAVPFDEDFDLSNANNFAMAEMWHSSNPAFALAPMLTHAAIRAITQHGTPEQQETYLPKMVSGEWTGTMVLTEPQAGSFLPALTTRAEPQDDGSYEITGSKNFITYGNHDMGGSADDPKGNIIHTVLAKIQGSDKITMFIVPKYDLETGKPNNVDSIGLEHKMGIHGSPTATMAFDGAKGEVLGKPDRGLQNMFTMMNEARLQVGIQGVAVADRAYQASLRYAQGREQGPIDPETGKQTAIIKHPDVQRMLMIMKSKTEAARALAYSAGIAVDQAEAGDEAAAARVEMLTPIVKAWCTDVGCEVSDLAIEVHGGYGYTKAYGVEQFARDARIFRLYEGTNGIQAGDLAGRKVAKDEGKMAHIYINELNAMIAGSEEHEDFRSILKELRAATDRIVSYAQQGNFAAVNAAARPYLQAFGIIAGGVLLQKSAHVAAELGNDPAFADNKQKTADFYFDNVLPEAGAKIDSIACASAFVDDNDPSFLANLEHG